MIYFQKALRAITPDFALLQNVHFVSYWLISVRKIGKVYHDVSATTESQVFRTLETRIVLKDFIILVFFYFVHISILINFYDFIYSQ